MLIVTQDRAVETPFEVTQNGKPLSPAVTGKLTDRQARWVKTVRLTEGSYEMRYNNGAVCPFSVQE